MLHLACLLHHLGSRGFQLHRLEFLLPVLRTGCASSVAVQVTVLETAGRIRISWHFPQLAVATTRTATSTLSLLMFVVRPTTLIWVKLKTSLLP